MARIPLRSRPVAATIVLLAAAGVLISAAAAYRLLRVSRDLTAGKNALVRVEPRLRAEDLAGARRLMTVAHNRTLRAGVRLHNSPELSLINLVPVAHQNLRAIRQSVDLGLKMVDAGSRLLEAATPLADASSRRDQPLRSRELQFACRHRAMHKRKGDIATEQRAAVVGNAGEERIGERADGGNGGDAKHQRGEENAKAGKAAAQFAPRQPNSEKKA